MSSLNTPSDTSSSSSLAASRVALALVGAHGRVCSRIAHLARNDASLDIILAATHASSASLGHAIDARSELRSVTIEQAIEVARSQSRKIDTVIDFSSDHGTIGAIALANAAHSALLVGTTGLSEGAINALKAASARCPVLLCSNTSVGIAAVASAAASLARALGPGYRASIVEQHHIHKKDAPSGTAKRLANALREAGADIVDNQIFAIRAGDIIGEHTIRLSGPGETIELTHRATTRDLFAIGALRLARWLAGRQPGWYSVEDSIN